MWKAKLRNFLRFTKVTKKQIKIGILAAFIATVLHSTASTQIILAVLVFVSFSLYLYLEALNEKMTQVLKDKEQANLTYQNEKVSQDFSMGQVSPGDQLVKQEISDQEVFTSEYKQMIEDVADSIAKLVLRVEDIDERLVENEKGIKDLKQSSECLRNRIEEYKEMIQTLIQPQEQMKTMKQIQKHFTELDSQLKSFQEVESKLNILKDSSQHLQELKNIQDDITQLKVNSKTTNEAIQHFSKIPPYLTKFASVLRNINQRVLEIEKNNDNPIDLASSVSSLSGNKNETKIKAFPGSLHVSDQTIGKAKIPFQKDLREYYSNIVSRRSHKSNLKH